jgi:hypothetical protein
MIAEVIGVHMQIGVHTQAVAGIDETGGRRGLKGLTCRLDGF